MGHRKETEGEGRGKTLKEKGKNWEKMTKVTAKNCAQGLTMGQIQSKLPMQDRVWNTHPQASSLR